MKNFVLTLGFIAAAASSSQAAGSYQSLVCKNSKGDTLEWLQAFGELIVTSKTGKELENIDGLALGEVMFLEMLPPIKIQKIVNSDEPDVEVMSISSGGIENETQVEFDGEVFGKCKTVTKRN